MSYVYGGFLSFLISSYNGDMLTNNKYVVIEGIDGAGKTTQKKLLVDYLQLNNQVVCDIKEPGGTRLGEEIRPIIKNSHIIRSAETDFELFNICRRELAQQVIRQELSLGHWVVCDRNWFSSLAYQGFGQGLSVESIVTQTKKSLTDLFLPDISIIIDLPIDVAFNRLRKRHDDVSSDNFESRGLDFYKKVRDGYLWLIKNYSIHKIDGQQSIETINQSIIELVQD